MSWFEGGQCHSDQAAASAYGFTGRQRSNTECEAYLKIMFFTGLEGETQPCQCHYYGCTAARRTELPPCTPTWLRIYNLPYAAPSD